MMMTPQNAMRQQQQHQQLDRGLAMFVRDPVKLDPTEHCPHVLTSPSEIMFSGVVDACVDEERLLGAAHQEYKAGNYKQALKHCSLVHEKNPQRTDALLLLGAIYYQLCDFDMCIVKNEEAIRIEPQFAECYGNMANALKEKGDIDLAIHYYTVAIELKPNFCDAWSNLSSAYMRKGHLQEAAECCQHALMLNPHLVDAHSNLGNMLKAQGLTHHAYLCYMEAIRLQPTFAIAWSNLAGLFMEAG
jgi:protein O-GlcNAc transferase